MTVSRSLRGTLLAGVATFAATTGVAQDGGLEMVIGLTQRLDVGSNVGLAVPDEGRTTLSTTRLSFGLSSETELSRLSFTASSALLLEDSFDTDGIETDFGRPELTFAFTREVPASIFEVTARYRSDDVDAFDSTLSADDAIGTRTDTGASLRLETGRTSALGFVIGASYDETDYDDTVDPDIYDNTIARANVEAILRFSELVTGRVGLAFSHGEEDNLPQTVTDTTTLTAGLDYTVSERLRLAASLGITEIDTEEFGVTGTTRGPVGRLGFVYGMSNGTLSGDLSVSRSADEDTRTTLAFGREMTFPAATLSARVGATHTDAAGTDIIGLIAWNQELPDGELGVRVERSVGFDDSDDEAVVNSIAAVDWSMDVNAVSSVALDFSYEVSDSPTERVEETGFGATYNYSLTADWGLASGLRYVVRDDVDGRADSPSVFVAISRDFELRP